VVLPTSYPKRSRSLSETHIEVFHETAAMLLWYFGWLGVQIKEKSTEDSVRLGHGGLNVDTLEVLPSLLEEGDEEVERHVDVLSDLLVFEVGGGNGGGQADNLLELELDGGLEFLDLGLDGLTFGDGDGELSDLVEDGTAESGDLLHEGFRADQSVERLSPLLDKLGFLVELLKTFSVDEGDTSSSSFFAVFHGADNSDLLVRVGHVGELDRAGETFILVGIVVSQTNLQLNSLVEVTLLTFFLHQLDGGGKCLR
jgi:hypothetical protein